MKTLGSYNPVTDETNIYVYWEEGEKIWAMTQRHSKVECASKSGIPVYVTVPGRIEMVL